MATRLPFVLAAVFLIAGCQPAPESTRRFVLPEGDAERGEQTFLRLRCYDCHVIPGVRLPVAEEPNQVAVTLGGKVSRVKTYGDLLTAIVHPSHKLARGYTETLVADDGVSRMTNYNEVMTVAELIDLVAYLQPRYRLARPEPSSPAAPYPYY